MKILKHGDPEAINALDYKLECHNCGAIFLFNHTEILSQERKFPGEAIIRCPDCNQIIYFMPEDALYLEEEEE